MRGTSASVANALRELYGTDDPDGERGPRLPDPDDFDGYEKWNPPLPHRPSSQAVAEFTSDDPTVRARRMRWRFYCNRDHPQMRAASRTNRFQTDWASQEYTRRLAAAHVRRHHPDLELRENPVGLRDGLAPSPDGAGALT